MKKKPFRRRKSSQRSAPASSPDGDSALRLQKVMAAAGIGSRRHCEELILAGRVDVDGKNVRKLGTKVDPATQEVRVDGTPLKKSRRGPAYYLVNKPEGVVSTNSDPSGRMRVVDLVPQHEGEHLFTVGRLDLSSEGLILVTNDGELANRLTHPRFGIEKTYSALVAGKIEQAMIDKLRHGVHLAEGVARCVSVHVRKSLPQSTLLEIVLAEGKNREIRRILAKVGHKVMKLKRIGIGPVKLRDLKPGEYRKPTRDELQALRDARPTPRPKPTKSRRESTSPEDESAFVTTVTPIVDDRDPVGSNERFDAHKPEPRGKRDGGDRRSGKRRDDRRGGKKREPGIGTIIGGN